MHRNEIIDALLSTIFSRENGWNVADRHEYATCDVTVENDDREVWLVNVAANGQEAPNFDDVLYTTIGRLLPAMTRDYEVNSLGLAERDDRQDPALVRYGVALPDTRACINSAARIPNRVRRVLQLSLIVVSPGSCGLFLPSVPIAV
jgi:hypothetical protein